MADDEKVQAAVYVPWTTFKNALESLAQGIPNNVNRTAFPGFSWAIQSQLLAGLKFLKLIEENGTPTAALRSLEKTDEPTRKEKLKSILRERYSALFALDLTKATPQELQQQISTSYNVSGSTRDKAIRFFLAAVEYVGIPVSRFLKQQPASNGTAPVKRRRTNRPKAANESSAPPSAQPAAASGGTFRTVALKSGGTLTVSASIDVFKLNSADRAFVFGLIDKLEEYEGEGQAGEEE